MKRKLFGCPNKKKGQKNMNANIIKRVSNELSTSCIVNTAQEAENILKVAEGLNNLTSGLISYVLKQVSEKNLFKEYGVKSTSAFAEKVLNISRSTASEYVRISKYLVSPNETIFKNDTGDFSISVLVECLRQKLSDEDIEKLPRDITVKALRNRKKVIEPDGSELEKENTDESETKEQTAEPARETDKYKMTAIAIDGRYDDISGIEYTMADIVGEKTTLEKQGYIALAKYGDTITLVAVKPNEKNVTTIFHEYKKI